MTKEAAKHFWGIEPDYDIAYFYHNIGTIACGAGKREWKTVTYTEIIRNKTVKQLKKLERKRSYEITIPCKIGVRKHYSAYYIYILNKHKGFSLFGNDESMKEKLMQVFNFGIISHPVFFEDWCHLFYKNMRKIKVSDFIVAVDVCYCRVPVNSTNIIDLLPIRR